MKKRTTEQEIRAFEREYEKQWPISKTRDSDTTNTRGFGMNVPTSIEMPDEIYAHAVLRRGDEVLLDTDTKPLNTPDCTRYIRDDIHEALKAEVQALKKELLAVIVDRNEWMDETSQGPADGSEARIQQLESEINGGGS